MWQKTYFFTYESAVRKLSALLSASWNSMVEQACSVDYKNRCIPKNKLNFWQIPAEIDSFSRRFNCSQNRQICNYDAKMKKSLLDGCQKAQRKKLRK